MKNLLLVFLVVTIYGKSFAFRMNSLNECVEKSKFVKIEKGIESECHYLLK